MTDNAWQVVGRLVKARRERLGVAQGDLQKHGGPGVTTVSKIERAAQANFPLRTQQQLEQALGWRRGTVEDVVEAVTDGAWERIGEDLQAQLVEHDLPNLAATPAPPPARRAVDLSDAELLAELTYRVRAYAEAAERDRPATPAQVVQAELARRGRNPGWLMDASGLAVDELMPFLAGQATLSAAQAARVESALGWEPGALTAPQQPATPSGAAQERRAV